ncbi:MAG: 2-dehydropantoate 2-reductase [Rhodospirillales bacterium]|jgi:2-dehydropantoate 2-reductase|nr:2-dehydropantoate 2-reductase [Rhodospirillales bacterium]
MGEERTTRFAVMGAGGVGGYFGARLAEAGYPVAVIARGDHLRAIRERGIAVNSPSGDVTFKPTIATDDAGAIGPVDAVLFAVKLYDVEEAANAIRPLLGAETMVLALQNGVDAAERIAPIVGEDRVIGGATYIFATIDAPGVIRHMGGLARIVFGELDGHASARTEKLLACMQAAHIDADLSTNITAELWRKFVILASMSAITCLARLPYGPIVGDPESLALCETAMREVEAVARARNVALAADVVAQHMTAIGRYGPDVNTSMYRDLVGGRRMEVEHLSGAVARLGEESGVDTPFHRAAYALLKLYADGPPSLVS